MNLFVTGTNTDVGKTHISAQLAKQAISRGQKVCYYKLIETGVLNDPLDEAVVKREVNSPNLITKTLQTFKKPASPHLSASLENRKIDFFEMVKNTRQLPLGDLTLWEGAGGVLVPINEKYYVIDFAKALGTEVLVVGRAGLGAINEMLTTIECVERRSITINRVILNMAGQKNDMEIVANNVETIQKKTKIKVEVWQ